MRPQEIPILLVDLKVAKTILSMAKEVMVMEQEETCRQVTLVEILMEDSAVLDNNLDMEIMDKDKALLNMVEITNTHNIQDSQLRQDTTRVEVTNNF